MTTKTKTKTFISYGPNLQVVVQAGRYESRNPFNEVVTPAIPEKYANFEGNRLETDDPQTIECLENHELYGLPRGFWAEGDAPDEPKPTIKTQRRAITKATADRDVPALREMLDEERAGHNRPDVVDDIEEAISALTVPEAEEHGRIGRLDEPAEKADGVPKVDPPDTAQHGRVQPEVDRERIIKSEEVAEQRANAVAAQTTEEPPEPPTGPVEEKLLEEVEVVAGDPAKQPEGEKLPEKIAAAGKAARPQARTGGKSSKKAKEEAEKIRETMTPIPTAEPATSQAEREAEAGEPETPKTVKPTAQDVKDAKAVRESIPSSAFSGGVETPEEQEATPEVGTGPLESRTVEQLQALAAERDLEGRSKLTTKKDLVAALRGNASEGASKSTAKEKASGADSGSGKK